MFLFFFLCLYICFSQLQGLRRDKQHYSWPSVTSCHWWWMPFAQEEQTCLWWMTKGTLRCGWLWRMAWKILHPRWWDECWCNQFRDDDTLRVPRWYTGSYLAFIQDEKKTGKCNLMKLDQSSGIGLIFRFTLDSFWMYLESQYIYMHI